MWSSAPSENMHRPSCSGSSSFPHASSTGGTRGLASSSSSVDAASISGLAPVSSSPEPVMLSSGEIPGRGLGNTSQSLSRKGKEKASKSVVQPERRVLPARIRRAAGGGAEGIRDLEEMVVDWLDRSGQVSLTPPDTLSIELTSIPYSLVDPPTFTSSNAQPQAPAVTVTPSKSGASVPLSPPLKIGEMVVREKELIETPSWKMVDPGEDDAEEAREELIFAAAHPNKRLRGVSDSLEDTSDAYYTQIHRKYEVFERRQRIRERETIQFERYKMRSRIELLRGMSTPAWVTVVSTVLARKDDVGRWAKGRVKLESQGMDWLRRQLIREGMEIIKRYDQLLPPPAPKTKTQTEGRPATISATSSLSPPPTLAPTLTSAQPGPAPQRVLKLRDDQPTSSSFSKRRLSTSSRDGGSSVIETSPRQSPNRSGSVKHLKDRVRVAHSQSASKSQSNTSPVKVKVKTPKTLLDRQTTLSGSPARVTRRSAAAQVVQLKPETMVASPKPAVIQSMSSTKSAVTTEFPTNVAALATDDVKPIHPFFKSALTSRTKPPNTKTTPTSETTKKAASTPKVNPPATSTILLTHSSTVPPLTTDKASTAQPKSKPAPATPATPSTFIPPSTSTPAPTPTTALTPSFPPTHSLTPTAAASQTSTVTDGRSSRVPCLIAAAARREHAIYRGQHPASVNFSPVSPVSAVTKTTPRRVLAAFGVPLPGVVEFESEFCINKLEEFFAVIARREAERMIVPPSLPEDEAMDVEGVEAAVL